jgi:RimJ/RimL family protein N-acetyltransferase
MKFPDTFETAHFRFVNYTQLSLDDSKKVWNARNNSEISKYMVNTDFIPWENHLAFIEGLSSRNDRVYYGVYVLQDNTMIGSQGVNPIVGDGTGESGLYLFPEAQGKGYGKLMKQEFIHYIFEQGLLNVVTEKVKFDNVRNQQLNLKLGFRQMGTDGEFVYFELRN